MRIVDVDGTAVHFFTDAREWADWLAEHHARAPELWMGFNKKHVVPRGLEWADAVEQALRYGWIDSQARRIDQDTMRQRWTPRRPGSIWSTVNLATVERLREQGLMEPAGLAVWQARKPGNEGVYAFEQAETPWSAEQQATLAASPDALAFWELATEGYRKTCRHWVNQAKQPATRQRRLEQLVDDCAHGRLIPSQRYGTPPAWLARAYATLGLTDRGPSAD